MNCSYTFLQYFTWYLSLDVLGAFLVWAIVLSHDFSPTLLKRETLWHCPLKKNHIFLVQLTYFSNTILRYTVTKRSRFALEQRNKNIKCNVKNGNVATIKSLVISTSLFTLGSTMNGNRHIKPGRRVRQYCIAEAIFLAPVVEGLDNAFQRINHYLVDSQHLSTG